MAIRIESASPADAPTLTDIAISAKRSWGYPDRWIDYWRSDLTVTSEDFADKKYLAAYEDGDVCGFCSLWIGSASAELRDLWVRPSSMAKGIGTALLTRALEEARTCKVATLQLDSVPFAESFFMRRGFVRIGEKMSKLEERERPRLKKRLESEWSIELQPVDSAPPLSLLLLADPSPDLIADYLQTGRCYRAFMGEETVAALVLCQLSESEWEVKNVAVREDLQGKGLGRRLLQFAEAEVRWLRGITLWVGTGNSSIEQLRFYQRNGFRITEIKHDFFVERYREQIVENGIWCRDMVMLRKDL